MTCCLAAGLLCALAAAEAPTPTMRIGTQGCESVGHDEIEAHITSEVEARRLEATTIRLVVTCGDAVAIEAFRARDEARASRQVKLDQVALPVRARVVALAAVELIEALQPPPSPVVKAPVVDPVEPTNQAPPLTARAAGSAWHVGALALIDHIPGAVGWMPGVGIESGWHNGTWGGLVSLAAHAVTRELTLGQGRAEAGRMDAWLVRRHAWQNGSMMAAAGMRLGISRLSGMPVEATNVGKEFWSAWGGPAAGLGVDLNLTRSWFVQLRYEIGYAIVSSVGIDEAGPDLGFSGVWHGPRLVVGVTSEPR